MTRLVTLSAVQTPSGAAGAPEEIRAANIERACEMLAEAGERGSDAVLLPEMFPLVGLRLDAETARAYAEDVEGPLFSRLAGLAGAHHMYVLAPVYACESGVLHNTVWIIDRQGKLAGSYHKLHPTQGERSVGVVPGDALPVFDLDFGRIGVMTCHDNSFPETARCLALEGAEVVFWPHVQGGWGDIAWDAVYYRSRTIDNHLILVAACPAGAAPGRAWMPGMMVGRSAIVNRDGFSIAETGRHAGIATTTVDLAAPRLVGSFTRDGEDAPLWPLVLEDRRPDAYGAITRPK